MHTSNVIASTWITCKFCAGASGLSLPEQEESSPWCASCLGDKTQNCVMSTCRPQKCCSGRNNVRAVFSAVRQVRVSGVSVLMHFGFGWRLEGFHVFYLMYVKETEELYFTNCHSC